MHKKSSIVESDSSSLDEKYDSLNKARIAKRTRNTYRQHILTLEDDEEYLKLLLKPKYRYATRSEENCSLNQKVLTDYFKDSAQNLYVMQTNYSLHRRVGMIARMAIPAAEVSVAMYVSTNSNLKEENGSKNKKITTSELILLSRFDPSQKYEHKNLTEVGTLKYEYFGGEIGPRVPHFHFASKTQSLLYGDTAESDAISIDNLIKYVMDLMKVNKGCFLSYDDLNMPYLQIRNKPELYQTNTSIQSLVNIIPPQKLVQKPFLFGAVDKRADLFGLEAVLFDLILLRGLNKEFQEFMKYSQQVSDFDSSIVKLMSLLAAKVTTVGNNQSINSELMGMLEHINGFNDNF